MSAKNRIITNIILVAVVRGVFKNFEPNPVRREIDSRTHTFIFQHIYHLCHCSFGHEGFQCQ